MRSVAIVLASVALAHAGGDATPKADELFAEAQSLRDAGKDAEACQKFKEALQYNHNALGTILNVALCDEQAGKLASAVKLFTDARDLARERKSPEHLQAAEDHLAKDEPLVAHLAIAFTERPGAETKLLIDDEIVPTGAAGDIPVDPGSHTVTVTAPGRVSNVTRIEIRRLEHQALAIPKLAYPIAATSTRRTIGKVLVFGGAGAIATGVVLGLVARAHYRAEFQPPGTSPCHETGNTTICDVDGYSKLQSARTLGNVGTVVGVAGAAAVGVGAFLWWVRRHEPLDRLAVMPVLTFDRGGLAAIGWF